MTKNLSKIKEIIADSASEEQKEATSPETRRDTSMIEDESRELSSDRDEYLQQLIEDLKHYRKLRNRYAGCVFVFMCFWAVIMFSMLFIKGFLGQCFTLSDTILTTLVGGTTVSVIGLVGFMMQGLFHSNGANGSKQKQYFIKV
ncbi:hypothetical protein [uncultured Rikenella sp.]|uniref:hypothetical protein n=1 Tax=uncultured Rikenella sp. TaxID=368003 RepID=UPI0025EA9B57|nr:hypothetical protein [uncultured Rikenella sp.]